MDILYKYVPAERVLACLPEVGNGTLRATQPSALNDPFECSVARLFRDQDEGKASESLAHVLSCWQPAKMAQCETREIRGRIGVS